MDKSKPVNLQLTTIRFPIPAISSILHRISGFILFLFIPFLLWLLQESLASGKSFASIGQFLTHPFVKFIVWGLLSMLIYHFIAGVRHLLMDAGIGESKESGKKSATSVIVLSILVILLLGLWIW